MPPPGNEARWRPAPLRRRDPAARRGSRSGGPVNRLGRSKAPRLTKGCPAAPANSDAQRPIWTPPPGQRIVRVAMTLQPGSLMAAFLLVCSGCSAPPQNPGPDPGADSGPVVGSCSSPCAPNQRCDTERHVCVDLCDGLCAIGQICVNKNGTPTCELPACGGSVCGQGQTSCIANQCSCLPFSIAQPDTCAAQGRVCHQIYNAVTGQGGACENPRLYEFCAFSCPDGNCTCGAGRACTDVVTVGFSICARKCAANGCALDELCAAVPDGGVCLLNGVFPNLGCTNAITLADGGTGLGRTAAGDVCFRLDPSGRPTERTPTGTCSWVLVRSDSRAMPVDYCRSPGPVPRFGACKTDVLPLDLAETCSTGLECVPVGHRNDGICLTPCNAALVPGDAGATPACAPEESCVNFHRFSDAQRVLGACMTSCNVFSTRPNFGCTPYGTSATSCVPTSPSGVVRVSPNGDGICAPQLPEARPEGEPCVETDAFRGAACLSGLICAQISGEAQPRCVKPCDLDCAGVADAAEPARCAAEANARCTGGRICTRVTATAGAILGFCL
jgi:hypothetical protein